MRGPCRQHNGDGHVIVPNDHFIALPSRRVLSTNFGHEHEVRVTYHGRTVVAPVWDIGPWNTRDDYWSPPQIREMFKDLPRGKPEAEAANLEGYNGGLDERGRVVRTPAGIDLADGTFRLDLTLLVNDWIEVEYSWLDTIGPATNVIALPNPATQSSTIKIDATVTDGRTMRIAQIAPPWEPVPPVGYGGTERVVHYITEELVRLGHRVTLFASGDSRTSAELHAVSPRSMRAEGIHLHEGAPFFVEELEQVRQRAADFDLIHAHTDYFAFPLARSTAGRPPVVHTLHGRLDLRELAPVFRQFADQPLVSISDSQRTPLPDQNWAATIYHGLPSDLYRLHERASDYVLFLGRMSVEKHPDWAVEIARRAGLRLVIAAKIDLHDRPFFDEVMVPLLERSPGVEFIGEVTDQQKNDLIGGAIALLMPIDWPEPFGLTAIEALACGTPVVARPCGAIPELITDGVDGFVHSDIGQLAEILGTRIGDISRKRCRETFDTRFTAARMAAAYVELYERLVLAGDAPKAVATVEHSWSTADSALVASIPKNVLKDNHAYAVLDPLGDIPEELRGEFGFYNHGTRYLSELELKINGEQPCLLASRYEPESQRMVIDLGNDHFVVAGGHAVHQNSIHLRRELSIRNDKLEQRITMKSFADRTLPIEVSMSIGGDFADLFEVRGTMRKQRGQRVGFTPAAGGDGGAISYIGLDNVQRALTFAFNHAAVRNGSPFVWPISLEPSEEWILEATFDGRTDSSRKTFCVLGTDEKLAGWTHASPHIETNHEILNSALRQAFSDLGELMSMGTDGLFPTAGIPWYATLFGRDSIFTALQLIPWRIDTAMSTFFTLAHFQADSSDDFTDREPGKILHEWREGEMANLREIPFIPYYGTVDATPLFVHLAYEMYAATADGPLLRRMWPHVVRAIAWIEHESDLTGSGLLDYRCRSSIGLRNQGWKDSWDGISHADGRLAEGAIAVVEVQAYAVQALREAAVLARATGHADVAQRWERRAQHLAALIDRLFWMDEESTYGLALDGRRELCRVVSSNAGHVLFSGVTDPPRARQIARRLLEPDLFTHFGIRTLSRDAQRFNPMRYHNGSIWPHDNAIIAAGFRRYGLLEEMSRVHTSLLAAIDTFALRRVPELYCGFDLDVSARPVAYPTACAPQAWSSGTVLWMVSQMLGLRVDGEKRTISLGPLAFPEGVDWIEVRNLNLAGERHDFVVTREGVRVTSRGGFHVSMKDRMTAVELNP